MVISHSCDSLPEGTFWFMGDIRLIIVDGVSTSQTGRPRLVKVLRVTSFEGSSAFLWDIQNYSRFYMVYYGLSQKTESSWDVFIWD